MIQDSTLKDAIREAKRFIETAEELVTLRSQPPKIHSLGGGRTYEYRPSEVREHAACKRASMDLTRTLADLRASR